MTLSDNARRVLEKRYVSRDEFGNPIETVEELFIRVARDIAKGDEPYGGDVAETEKEFLKLMQNLEFLPNSPTLMNAGKELGQLSGCFVLPIEDTMEGIFDSIKYAALVHKSGGGTGFSFSRLRQSGSVVKSTGGVASGPISFMKVFNAATEAVKQGGVRRGANMGILRVDHPDIMDFITCKSDNKDINNFNISIGITEKFMNAVVNKETYNLIDPKTKKVVKEVSAAEVYAKIVEGAWKNGEPGIVFLDRINRDNPIPSQGEIEATNPCGEQPLLPYESCNLGSINLVKMLKRTNKFKTIAGGFKTDYVIDEAKLKRTVRTAVHFLDNVIERNKYPLPEIERVTLSTRKIGLGVMGFADMLIYLGIPYASDEAISIARRVMSIIRNEGRKASADLAKIRGPFPLFNESIYKDDEPLRNATITTIAPTGTLSMIAAVSSGVEPLFAISEVKTVMDGQKFYKTNERFTEYLKETGRNVDSIIQKIIDNHGSLSKLDEELSDEIIEIFGTAHDISSIWHIRMQAAFQENTDNAVSKTVNCSNNATIADVDSVFMTAYQLSCKGVTIYRDGSREEQVYTVAGSKHTKDDKPLEAEVVEDVDEEEEEEEDIIIAPRRRPREVCGYTTKVNIGCGKLYVTVNYDEKGICEVLTNNGKGGGCPSQSEATTRLASIALRSGLNVEDIVDQLKGIRCPSTVNRKLDNGKTNVLSCPDAIGKVIEHVNMRVRNKINRNALSKNIDTTKESQQTTDTAKKYGGACPECGKPVEHEGGCVICKNCGYSKCG